MVDDFWFTQYSVAVFAVVNANWTVPEKPAGAFQLTVALLLSLLSLCVTALLFSPQAVNFPLVTESKVPMGLPSLSRALRRNPLNLVPSCDPIVTLIFLLLFLVAVRVYGEGSSFGSTPCWGVMSEQASGGAPFL